MDLARCTQEVIAMIQVKTTKVIVRREGWREETSAELMCCMACGKVITAVVY